MFCKTNYNYIATESELHALNDCYLYNFARRETKEKIPDKTILDLFTNNDANFYNNVLAGKLAFNIQEVHKAFSDYYTDSQHAHQSTGKCIIM